MGIWQWSNQEKPQGVDLRFTIAAITVDGGRPYVFAPGSDRNLWVHWWDGGAWHWSNQGTPPGINFITSPTDPISAITVDGSRPYAFVGGDDGNLWVNWWDGRAWHWSNQGTPPGIDITTPMGATTVDGGRPYVFVGGDDGNLWVNWWDGRAWHWSNQETPEAASISYTLIGALTTVDGGRPYIFTGSYDDSIWVNWRDGGAWHWSNQEKPQGVDLLSPMGVTTVDGRRPYFFVTGSDNNLWINWWDGGAWHWSNQGTPQGVTFYSVNAMGGAITVDGSRPHVFVIGSDGNLWVNWWGSGAWHWSNQGTPPGIDLNYPMDTIGAITVDGSRPYAFVIGSDGNLWVNWWSN